MMGHGTRRLLAALLLGIMVMVLVLLPGAPVDISRNNPDLQLLVLSSTYSFNNQSNDAFLYRPTAITSAQKQVVNGVRYIADFNICRTTCRKRHNHDLKTCSCQPAGPLHQVFHCHLEVWVIPWEGKYQTQVFTCRS